MTESDAVRIAGQIGALEARVANLELGIAEQHGDIKCILETLNEARGGWKGMVVLATVAGAAGAALTKVGTVLQLMK